MIVMDESIVAKGRSLLLVTSHLRSSAFIRGSMPLLDKRPWR
jgi:hypothetical protein